MGGGREEREGKEIGTAKESDKERSTEEKDTFQKP